MTKEISISNVEEFSNEDSIDKAIELLQELKTQEDHNGAFVMTTAYDDPANPSVAILSCVCTGPLDSQLTSLLEYINKDTRIMPALKQYS